MAKKQYPLRVDPDLWSAVEQWAADELRSVNGQMEYIIRDSLKHAGRLPKHTGHSRTNMRRADSHTDESPQQSANHSDGQSLESHESVEPSKLRD